MTRDRIIQAIYNAIDEVNEELPRELQLAKSPSTVLFGESSPLDSLGLVNLIVTSEQELAAEFNTSLTLADERALSLENSPFRTIGTLAEYVSQLLEESARG